MKSFIRLASLVAAFSGLVLVGVPTLSVSSQGQNQQRPRRVNGAENQTPAKGSSTSTTEEVDEGDVVRVETKLVSVPAVITNSAGRPMVGLRRENFAVFEDGQPQSIANFGTTDTPFEIALLLDTSGSTRDDVALIRQAANSFINACVLGSNCSSAFNTERRRLSGCNVRFVPITGDRASLQKHSESWLSYGKPFYDALDRIVGEVFRESPEEKSRPGVLGGFEEGLDSGAYRFASRVRAAHRRRRGFHQ